MVFVEKLMKEVLHQEDLIMN